MGDIEVRHLWNKFSGPVNLISSETLITCSCAVIVNRRTMVLQVPFCESETLATLGIVTVCVLAGGKLKICLSHIPTDTHTHRHRYTHIHYTHIHTRAHAYTHTRMHTHIYTHTHTNTYSIILMHIMIPISESFRTFCTIFENFSKKDCGSLLLPHNSYHCPVNVLRQVRNFTKAAIILVFLSTYNAMHSCTAIRPHKLRFKTFQNLIKLIRHWRSHLISQFQRNMLVN